MRKTLAVLLGLAFCGSMMSVVSFAGEPKKEGKAVGNVVSDAAHKAKAEGLKGTELAGKVHEAIHERKEARTLAMGEKKIKRGLGVGVKAKGRGKKGVGVKAKGRGKNR